SKQRGLHSGGPPRLAFCPPRLRCLRRDIRRGYFLSGGDLHGIARPSERSRPNNRRGLYPTGKYGPFHSAEDGTVEKHGTLITVERGATMRDAMERARASVNQDAVTHEHIACTNNE
ncbi:hypothetical protein BDN71DRAFT_198473, partial [Pleurotus eryngii]